MGFADVKDPVKRMGQNEQYVVTRLSFPHASQIQIERRGVHKWLIREAICACEGSYAAINEDKGDHHCPVVSTTSQKIGQTILLAAEKLGVRVANITWSPPPHVIQISSSLSTLLLLPSPYVYVLFGREVLPYPYPN